MENRFLQFEPGLQTPSIFISSLSSSSSSACFTSSISTFSFFASSSSSSSPVKIYQVFSSSENKVINLA